MASYSRAIASVKAPDSMSEQLHIGALPTAAGSIVPRVITEMRKKGCRFSLFVQTSSYEDMVGKLRIGELDFIVGRMVTRDMSGLAFEEVYSEDIVAAVAKDHPLAAGETISMSQLHSHTILVPSSNTLLRQAVEDFFFACGSPPPTDVIESASEGFSRAYTLNYQGVWFSPQGLVADDLERGHLVALPVHHSTLSAMIGFTTLTNNALSVTGRMFTTTMRELTG